MKRYQNLTKEEYNTLIYNKILIETIRSTNKAKDIYDIDILLENNQKQNLKGNILLYEDNWFEGLVYTQEKEEIFIFGIMLENNFIQIFYISSILSFPLMSYLNKESNNYEGNLELIGLSRREDYGKSSINLNSRKKRSPVGVKISEWKLDNALNRDVTFYIKLKTLSEELLELIINQNNNSESKLFDYQILTLRNSTLDEFFKEIHKVDISTYVSKEKSKKR